MFAEPLAQLSPMPGIEPYDVNVSLYSDGAQKQRFIWLPPGSDVHAAADRWVLPTGAYLIKNFYFPNDERDPTAGDHLVETRFLIQGDSGLTASTYVWNDDQTDAVVSGGNLDVPVHWIDTAGTAHDVSFHVPGTSLCESCHDNRELGWRTRQIVHPGTYSDGTTDQAAHLVAEGVLDAPPPAGLVLVDPTGSDPIDARARSYLDANCSHCHATVGDASSTGVFLDYESTDAAHLPLCKSTGTVGGNDKVIVPGHPEKSVLLSRMFASDPFVRMPRGPTRIPDPDGTAVISAWIQQMPPGGCE